MKTLLAWGLPLVAALLLGAGLAAPAGAGLKKVLFVLDGRVYAVTVGVAPGTPLREIDVPGFRRARVVGLRDLSASARTGPGRLSERRDGGPRDGSSPRRPDRRSGRPRPERGGHRSGPRPDRLGSAPRRPLRPLTPDNFDAGDRGAQDDDRARRLRARRERAHRLGRRRGRALAERLGRRERRSHRGRAELRRRAARRAATRRRDGTPTDRHPGLFDTGPGDELTGLPSFTLRHFRIPIFLLPVYQAAGARHGVDWEVLAAINEMETDYGRNLAVSSAGAVGWMQFMPATWRRYGVDADRDGERDPNNPVDAIFSAARYLEASGARRDLRGAIFAYNHADWYVDAVLLRARVIAGAPPELVGSLTGLSQGRFPVGGRARYADDTAARGRRGRGQGRGRTRARRSIDVFAAAGSPVVAVADGVVRKVGRSPGLGRHLVLEDDYGNRFTYSRLGSPARRVHAPAPRLRGFGPASAVAAPLGTTAAAVTGWVAAAAVLWLESPGHAPIAEPALANASLTGPRSGWALLRPLTRFVASAGRREKALTGGPKRRLRAGARVSAGATIARVGGGRAGRSSHVRFAIRPAGRGAGQIDPKPILDGWRLLEESAVAGGRGAQVLRPSESSVGRALMLPRRQLERRVLRDERIEVYGCGRRDIAAGRVDRRVLATLAYLAESGLSPTVTSLQCGHPYLTKSGNVSHHSSGDAVDIAAINGVPILGHQEPGGVTDQAVRRLMRLEGAMRPAQIISLLDRGANTLHMADHADHIHVGFEPDAAAPDRHSRLPTARAGWWDELEDRLGQIDNPVVPRRASRFALPARDVPAKSRRAGGD